MGSTLLILLILIPLVGALAVALGPARNAPRAAMIATLLPLALGAFLFLIFQWGSDAAAHQFTTEIGWLPQLGLSLSLGVDSVSLILIGLTLLLGPICVASSFTAISERTKTYYAWLLVLQAAMTGVFAARDLIFFYICFEFTLVPMYVLISLFGSTNRAKAATRFFLYTFTGSIIALAGLVYVAYFHFQTRGVWTFDIARLELAARAMSQGEQIWVMVAMLAGFAVKVPLFPVHTWLPLAHTEAPTAGSVILAGVLLKLGTYAIFRFVLPFVPQGVIEAAPVLAVICLIGIIYGGLICWVQTDVKKLVAYSSVAHLGFCMLGMFAMNTTGLSGSVMYMINHGLSTGALFLLIGMVYERYHTRSMRELGGLAARMPVWATFMVFFTMASVGLPGLNGFVSEFLCLMGAFQASDGWAGGSYGTPDLSAAVGSTPGEMGPFIAAIAGTGMIIAAIYLLYMVGKVVFGPLVEPGGHGHGDHGKDASGGGHGGPLPRDLSAREIAVLSPLAVLCVVLGIYPTPALDAIRGPIERTVQITSDAREQVRAARISDRPLDRKAPSEEPAGEPAAPDVPGTTEAQQ